MTTLGTAYAQLAALERSASEMREHGKSLLPAEYTRIGELHTVVRLELRAAAKAREGAK